MTFLNNYYLLPNNLNIPALPSFKQNGVPGVSYPNFREEKTTFTSFAERLGTASELEAEAKSNPVIRDLAQKYNIPIKVNEKKFEELKRGHLTECRVTAAKIASNLPQDLKSQVDMQALQEAAMYHDLGKILVPENVLEKNSSLNNNEWEIMELHSVFGYELAKNKGLSPKALELIKYHHQNAEGTGYPQITGDFNYDINNEILAAADKYCALREKRSYKNEMSQQDALDVLKNELSPEIYNALSKAVLI